VNTSVRYVGLDVHADTIVAAVAAEGRGEAKVVKSIPHEWRALQALLKSLQQQGKYTLMICYEAGPTGYLMYRKMKSAGFDCQVIAPSLVPKKSGQKVKTDRRDACALAQFLRSGDLTKVWVPDEACEALRDLSRAREAAKGAELNARQQLSKFLLRHGRRYAGKAWSQKHLEWIRQQQFEQEAQRRVLADYLKAVEDATQRVKHLVEDLEELSPTVTHLWPLIQALQAFRGIALVSAATLVAELGDLQRFGSAKQFMAYLGLNSREYQTGQTRIRGGITKSGNTHARRILVEAAHHARRLPAVSKTLRQRQAGVAPEVVRIANAAQQRLYKRLLHLTNKGKCRPKAVVAIARELAGFIWAVGQQEQLLAA
jgi:transposase